jgi:hypothetical protein
MRRRLPASLVLAVAVPLCGGVAAAEGLDPAAIGTAAGVAATATPEGVVRLAWPRDDVPVTVGGTRVLPVQGLGSWAALKVASGGALLRSETVLFDDEVQPAVDAAFAQGLLVTALDQPLLYATPRPVRLQLQGRGDALALAGALKAVWDAARAVRAAAPAPATRPPGDAPKPGSLDVAALGQALGVPVVAGDGGTARASIGRTVTEGRTSLGEAMGVATWAVFSGSDGAAALDAEVVATLPELQTTLRTLRVGGLALQSVGPHLVGEQPAVWFVRVRGTGPARQLAKAVRDTLDAQKAVAKR